MFKNTNFEIYFLQNSLNMFVEDRTSYNGPVQVTVKPTYTVAELKEHVECEFEIPVGVQKWILGKSLAEDDQSTLTSHGIDKSGQSIFLYLVAPKKETDVLEDNKPEVEEATGVQNKFPVGEHRKGRYWNYEEDRWSYCSGIYVDLEFNAKFAHQEAPPIC